MSIVITELLAILGVCLSTLAIVWNILRDINDKGKLQLKVMIGKLYPDHADKEYHYKHRASSSSCATMCNGGKKESKRKAKVVLLYLFSVNCIRKGISTRALQTLLGHDRLTITEIYLNLSPEDAIREFLNKW